jgi:hypothetical protein
MADTAFNVAIALHQTIVSGQFACCRIFSYGGLEIHWHKYQTTISQKNTPCVLQINERLSACDKKILLVPPCGITDKIDAPKNQILTFEGGKAAIWVK